MARCGSPASTIPRWSLLLQTRSASGSTDATILISSAALGAPTGLAFDKQHRLWVANLDHGTIVRFDSGQLASSGSPVPSVIIAGLGQPAALAFDAAGSLWVSDIRRDKIASFSEAQLSASGFVAPQVVISTLGTTLRNPAGIAFDADGNLWVANASNQTVVAFAPAQLSASGSPAPPHRSLHQRLAGQPRGPGVWIPMGHCGSWVMLMLSRNSRGHHSEGPARRRRAFDSLSRATRCCGTWRFGRSHPGCRSTRPTERPTGRSSGMSFAPLEPGNSFLCPIGGLSHAGSSGKIRRTDERPGRSHVLRAGPPADRGKTVSGKVGSNSSA